MDLKDSCHATQIPVASDLATVELSGILNCMRALIGLVEVNLGSAQSTLDMEYSDIVLSATSDLSISEGHVLEEDRRLVSELLK